MILKVHATFDLLLIPAQAENDLLNRESLKNADIIAAAKERNEVIDAKQKALLKHDARQKTAKRGRLLGCLTLLSSIFGGCASSTDLVVARDPALAEEEFERNWGAILTTVLELSSQVRARTRMSLPAPTFVSAGGWRWWNPTSLMKKKSGGLSVREENLVLFPFERSFNPLRSSCAVRRARTYGSRSPPCSTTPL